MKRIITLLTIVITFSCFSQVTKIVDADGIGPLVEFNNKHYLIQFGAFPGIKSTDGISNSLSTEHTGVNGATYSFTAKNDNTLYVVENTQSVTSLLVTNGTGGFTNIKSFTTSSSGSLPKIRLAPTLSVVATEEIKKTPNNFIGNKLIFTAIDPAAQILRLWVSEGTTATTTSILSFTSQEIDVLDDSFGENISGLVYFNGRTTTSENYHLWRTDGTSAGTFALTTTLGEKLYTPTKSTIENLNGELLFIATTTNTISPATDLWKTNGTPAGTIKLFGIVSHGVYNNTNTLPKFFGKVFKNNFYFFGNNNTLGYFALYKTDGTVAGTTLLKSSTNQNIKAPSVSIVFFNDDNYIYFPGKGRKEFAPNFFIDWDFYYASQGNSIDTKPIDDLSNIPTINFVYKTTDGLIVNTGNNSFKLNGYEKPVKTVFSSAQLNLTGAAYSHKSKAWFSASEGVSNEELWCSDGTQSGTKRFADIIAGSGSSGPKGFFSINNDLFFFAKFGSQTGGFSIYKIGEDYTFNGATSNNWSLGSNWNSGSTPTSVDNVTIPSGFNVNVDTNIAAKNATINSPITVSSGSINLFGATNLGAKITLNANNLNLKGINSSIVGNETNFVVTNGTGSVTVENIDTSRGTISLPIGTATNYNPVSIANSGTSDTFSVRVSDGISGTTNGTVNATWEIAEAVAGGSNVNLNLGWNQAQENGTFDRNTAKIGHFVSGNWTEETSGAVSGSNPYTLLGTGISSFSPFSVMNFSALSVSDFNESKMAIYPNPSNGEFTIQVSDSFVGGKATIYNLLGQVVKAYSMVETIQNATLEKGVYLIEINKGNQVCTKKIIIH